MGQKIEVVKFKDGTFGIRTNPMEQFGLGGLSEILNDNIDVDTSQFLDLSRIRDDGQVKWRDVATKACRTKEHIDEFLELLYQYTDRGVVVESVAEHDGKKVWREAPVDG